MTTTEDFKLKATDPNQYDASELDWTVLGDENHSSRLFFRDYLVKELEDLSGKKVLDIGSGVGQLFNTLKSFGAEKIVGIEPSFRNFEHSKNKYSEIEVYNGTLENFSTEDKFHVIICIAVFEHIVDIDSAFSKISSLLENEGTFYLMVADFDYNTTTRVNANGFEVVTETQTVDDETVATKTHYDGGLIYDIMRKLKSVTSSANKSNLKQIKNIDMISSNGNLAWHFLIFKK